MNALPATRFTLSRVFLALTLVFAAAMGMASGLGPRTAPAHANSMASSASDSTKPQQDETETPVPMPTATPLTPPPVPTCTAIFCEAPARELLELNDLVFRGTVTELEQLGPNEFWAHRVVFAAHEFWKGTPATRIELRVARTSWVCDRSFALGQETVVFAKIEPDGRYRIRRCDNTAIEDDPAAALGPGRSAEALLPVAHFGGAIVDIEVVEETAWIAQGPRVMAVDVSDRSAPRALGPGLQLPEVLRGLSVDGDRALARSESMLYLLDISEPANPVIVSRHRLETYQRRNGPVVLAGDLAFVVVSSSARRNIDVLALSTNRWIRFDLVDSASDRVLDLARLGDRLIVSTENVEDFQVGHLRLFPAQIDASLPEFGLTEVASVEEGFAGHLEIAEVEGEARVYSADWRERAIAAWAFQDGTSADRKGEWLPRAAELGDVAVLPDGAIYVEDYRQHGNTGIEARISRVTDETFQDRHVLEPTQLFRSRYFPAGIEVLGEEHLLLSDMSGLGILAPLAETQGPAYLPSLIDAAGLVSGPEGWLVGASNYGSFLTYDLSAPRSPRAAGHIVDIQRFGNLTASAELAVWNHYGPFDIPIQRNLVVDLGAPEAPFAAGLVEPDPNHHFPPMGLVGDLLVFGQELRLVDLSDPSAPVELDRLEVDGTVSHIVTEDDLVVIGYWVPEPDGPEHRKSKYFLKVARVEGSGDDRNLAEVADVQVASGGAVRDIVLDGQSVWISFQQTCSTPLPYWVAGYALSNPSRPIYLGWVALPGLGQNLAAAQGMLIVSGRWVVDIRQPNAPRVIGELYRGSGPIVIHDHHIYVADGRNGVWVYEPELPWADDPNVPTPTVPPTSTPGASPTPSPTPDCRPTPIVTISPTFTATFTTSPTAGTPEPEPGPESIIYLPWVEADRE